MDAKKYTFFVFFDVCFWISLCSEKTIRTTKNWGEGQLSVIDRGGGGARTEFLLFNFGLNSGLIGIAEKGKIPTK